MAYLAILAKGSQRTELAREAAHKILNMLSVITQRNEQRALHASPSCRATPPPGRTTPVHAGVPGARHVGKTTLVLRSLRTHVWRTCLRARTSQRCVGRTGSTRSGKRRVCSCATLESAARSSCWTKSRRCRTTAAPLSTRSRRRVRRRRLEPDRR